MGNFISIWKRIYCWSSIKKIEYNLSDINISNDNKQILKGISTGLFESLYMNPVMMARVMTNEYFSPNYDRKVLKTIKILNYKIVIMVLKVFIVEYNY